MWPEGSHDITKTTKRPLTAGTIFKNSMNELMKLLAMKEPFYVRCIKPNERKSPVTIDTERVIHQIRYFIDLLGSLASRDSFIGALSRKDK